VLKQATVIRHFFLLYLSFKPSSLSQYPCIKTQLTVIGIGRLNVLLVSQNYMGMQLTYSLVY